MTDRERLLEILNVPIHPRLDVNPLEAVADYLLDTGVTFAKDTNVPSWIPVSERLPDTFGEYAVTIKTIEGRLYSDYADYDPIAKKWYLSLFFAHNSKIVYWMPLPNPPKED